MNLAIPNVRELIAAGFHFGHRTSRWNPKMAPYIFKRRNLIHIIDLRETLRGLIVGRKLVEAVVAKGQYVLFVGTKKQAKAIVRREAGRCGMPFVSERWPGGMLTNYAIIRTRLERLAELEHLDQTGEMGLHSKKMISTLRRERRKIVRNLGGVRQMDRLPGLLVVADPAREHLAVREARKLGIPIIALADTDGDPDELDIIVPGNDDSIGAIDIYLTTMSEAVVQVLVARGQYVEPAPGPEGQSEAAPEPAGQDEEETPESVPEPEDEATVPSGESAAEDEMPDPGPPAEGEDAPQAAAEEDLP
jgi:small subunit ribosomal protein S2